MTNEQFIEEEKDAASASAELTAAEGMLHKRLHGHLSDGEIFERVRSLRKRVKEQARPPRVVAEETIDEYFRQIPND